MVRADRVFEHRGPGTAFEFVIPSTWIGSENVRKEINAGVWRVSYEDDGRTYHAEDVSLTAAMLKLVARRLGYEATIISAEG